MTNEFYNKVDGITLTETERNDAITEALWCAKLKKMLTPGVDRWALNREKEVPTRKSLGIVEKGLEAEYRAWLSARYRCTNEKCGSYEYYGGRGIEFRFTSFEEFLTVLGRRPSSKHSINRIDNDGHYEPGNVEWATASAQTANRRPRRDSLRVA